MRIKRRRLNFEITVVLVRVAHVRWRHYDDIVLTSYMIMETTVPVNNHITYIVSIGSEYFPFGHLFCVVTF